MRTIVLTVFLWSVLTVSATFAQTAPQGDAQKGRAQFSGRDGGAFCMLCHGANGQGGFGPDLAGGRGLTFDQFKKAVKEGWGVMPHYDLNDDGIANIYAFLKTLKPVAEPGPWGVAIPPPGAPLGQIIANSMGCGQCHGPEMGHPRSNIGGKGFDFAEFKDIVYEHAPAVMGHFRKERFTDPVLKEIWGFMQTQGFRALVLGQIAAGVPGNGGTTYTITVDNRGVAGKGLAADDVNINLVIPKGLTLANVSAKYELKKDAEYYPNPGKLSPYNNPNPDLSKVKGEIAVIKVSKLLAGKKETVTVTMSGPGSDRANFTGTTITWDKPDNKRIPGLAQKDNRLAERGDVIYAPSQDFSLPPPPSAAASAAQQ